MAANALHCNVFPTKIPSKMFHFCLSFFYLSKSKDVSKVDKDNFSFNFKSKSVNVKRRWLDKNWNVSKNRLWRKKHSSLVPFSNVKCLICDIFFILKKISLFPFQILTCQDQKSVCPPKATFFPRDIFKVKRGVPVLYLLPI